MTDLSKKRAAILSVGMLTFQLSRSLITPANSADKSLEELIGFLNAHYNPGPSEIVEQYKFHLFKARKLVELVATFLSKLYAQSVHSNFGLSLNNMLQDRLMCGINNDQMQKQLLSEPKLTFEKAIAIAQSMESAAMKSINCKV